MKNKSLIIIGALFLSITSQAQFDNTGYRYLMDQDDDNFNVVMKFTDTNVYVLRNTGKRKNGVVLDIISIRGYAKESKTYSFDNDLSLRVTSGLKVEQFAFDKGRLALLTNNGIFFSASPDKGIQLFTSELDAFEFNNLELSDSTLLIYRNSLKGDGGACFRIASVNMNSGRIKRITDEKKVNAEIYSNFRDPVVTVQNKEVYRADYVYPVIYRYKMNGTVSTISLDLLSDSSKKFIIPEELTSFLNSYSRISDATEFMDTTIKIKLSHYCNKQLVSTTNGRMLLLYSIPDARSVFQLSLSELSVSPTSVIVENNRVFQLSSDKEKPVEHVSEVKHMGRTIHICEDDTAFYFVISGATKLSPDGMTVGEYAKRNYRLQFDNTGLGVIRIVK